MQSTNGSAAPSKKARQPLIADRARSVDWRDPLTLSLPSVISRVGMIELLELNMSDEELADFTRALRCLAVIPLGAPFRSFEALTIERTRILLAHDRSVTKSSVTISGRGHSSSGSPPLRVQYLRLIEPKHALKLAACPQAVPGANLKSRTIGTLTIETSKPGRESAYILITTSEDASMRTNAVSIAASLVCWPSIALAHLKRLAARHHPAQ
jgi:hypothetical protein